MTSVFTKLTTALALGIPNIARVAGYRLSVKLGLNPARRLQAAIPSGPFFYSIGNVEPVSTLAMENLRQSVALFGWMHLPLTGLPPDWLANTLNGQRLSEPDRNWWEIPDFDSTVGDVKLIWELSRMDWVLALAQRVRQGDKVSLDTLNLWLADWCIHNQPYRGPNWKCGQEASFRILNLAMAAFILGQVDSITQSLRELLHLHLKRIAPTISYALAQDNNHGTSEAAALFVGGSWLASVGIADGTKWQHLGRKLLENRAEKLIGSNGTFSQYSLNYHRVMLDTYCIVELWRRHLSLTNFSVQLNEKLRLASNWLYAMVDSLSGDGPNVGANDGARLLQLAETDYRDFRPCIQLASAIFCGQLAYSQNGAFNDPLRWLNVPIPQKVALPAGNYVADDGGFAVMRHGVAMVMLRYPRFRFRPSQADLLHLDLWVRSKNFLKDAGTYSYNAEPYWLQYFSGTESHNTVHFDDRNQMPRLSRFLFGSWLKTSRFEAMSDTTESAEIGAGYCDSLGASHFRRVTLARHFLYVTDEIDGFKVKAVLRWRLAEGKWQFSHNGNNVEVIQDNLKLTVKSVMPIVNCELVDGWESVYYYKKTGITALEVTFNQPGTVTSKIEWVA